VRGVILLFLALLPVAGCLSDNDDGRPSGPFAVDSDNDGLPDVEDPTPFGLTLRYLPPVDLLCPTEGISGIQDEVQGNCGAFGEPVIEVAGDGAVWASATCCIGRSPPIWVSRDAGQSFQLLPFADRTGIVRDAFGIEGDFAIDDAGNVYFFDISAASSWFSKYQADGTHVFTKADAFPPLVDRPWVRAGVEDEVWVFYNTAMSTNLFHSTNGGLTWTVTPQTFNCALMTIGQGPERNRLFVAGCGGDPQLFISEDGGLTFGPSIALPVPDIVEENGTATDPFIPPVSDAAGNIYVFLEYAAGDAAKGRGLYLDVVLADGTVRGPFLVTNETTVNHKPWPAAGEEGKVAVAWYGTNTTYENGEFAEPPTWFLYTAAVHGALTETPTFEVGRADPDPVLVGEFGRQLGDFLESDIGPDGRHYVIYARRDDSGIMNRVVVSDGAMDFGKGVPYNGPLVG
jgi:hypothetical protein